MNIRKLIRDLYNRNPFLGFILMQLNVREDSTLYAPAGICLERGSLTLLYNPQKFSSYKEKEQIAIMEHEVLHLVFFHLQLAEDYENKHLFNIAADLEVNCYINNLPNNCYTVEKFSLPKKMGVKYYYKQLSNNENNQQKFDSECPTGDHSLWDSSKSEGCNDKIIEALITDVIRKAKQEGLQLGSNYGNLDSLINVFLQKNATPITNWRTFLKRLCSFSNQVTTKLSRKRMSIRNPDFGKLRVYPKNRVLLILDTSGSMGQAELNAAYTQMCFIKKHNKNLTLDVICCDTMISEVLEFKPNLFKAKGGGGTMFNPALKFYNDNRRKYSTAIFFTDGGFCDDKLLDTYKPVIWVLTNDSYEQHLRGIKLKLII